MSLTRLNIVQAKITVIFCVAD